MIYTVTLNPSIDYYVTTDSFELGKTNRTTTEMMIPGGKGINVAMVLSELGIEVTAMGFLAGFTGKWMEQQLKASGFETDFVYAKEGTTRINVKLKSHDGTEINGMGPQIGPEEIKTFLDRIDRNLSEGDTIVLSGSIPPCMPSTTYRDMMERFADRGIRFVVDASGKLLLDVLPLRPYLIKPNLHEAQELTDVKIRTKEDAFECARRLRRLGAQNVIISLGAEGAVFVSENDECYALKVSPQKVVSTVGAGDSMIGGFLYGSSRGGDIETAFRYAVAAGSATAFSEGMAKKEMIETLFLQMK